MESGRPGVCKYLSGCNWAQAEVRKGNHPKICVFSGPFPIVCCPPSGANESTTQPAAVIQPLLSNPPPDRRGVIATKKCAEYAEHVFAEVESLALMASTERVDRCAASADPLIVGGSEAKPMEFPHMALVGFERDGSIEYNCGGSLISSQFVMTAAHCLIAPWEAPARWVLLGDLDRSSDIDEAQPQVIEVKERIKHPNYVPPSKYDDIGLLKLEKRADINGYVRPACLHIDPEVRLRTDLLESLVATGWGHTEYAGESSNHLMKVALPPASLERCRKSFSRISARELPRGIDNDSQLCAGGVDGKDTCQGDSGGPLQLYTRNATGEAPQPYCMYIVVGITSFGRGCGFKDPAVYTRVAHYVPWIERVVWPGEGL